MRRTGLLIAAALATSAAASAAPASSPVGSWFDETKKAVIEISPCGQQLCGTITWLREPRLPDGRIKLDIHNDDPALRTRTICGLPLLSGFIPAGEPGVWEGGRIYDPQSGTLYKSTMRLQPDGTLRVRGFVGVSLFGQSQVWTRPSEKLPHCDASAT